MRKLNKNGFTLVELLAVLVILIAIMGVAIPSISSSMERSKKRQEEQKIEVFKSAMESYVTDHRNSCSSGCSMTLEQLINGGYLLDSEIKKVEGNETYNGRVSYNSSERTYQYNE